MALRHAVLAASALCLLALLLPAASAAPPQPPTVCQTGIAGTDCAVGYGPCAAHAGYRTGSESYEYAGAYCGPPTFAPCTVAYVDTRGNVASCLFTT
jgi:hypothetical protein